MNIGFGAPVSGAWATPASLAEFARAAEAAGYSTLWSFQRLLIPAGSGMEPVYHDVLDPMAALAFAAAVTRTIRLGVAVINLPFVSPGYLAKQAASVDVLSAGRHELGLGIGWMPEEFRLTGADMARRGARAAEYVQALRRLWSADTSEFSGEFYHVPAGDQSPKPVQPGGPPILLGGMAERALQRIGRVADGWVTSSRTDLSRIAKLIAVVRESAEAARPGSGRAAGGVPRRRAGRGASHRARRRAAAAVGQHRPDPGRRGLARRAGRDRGLLRPQLGPADRQPGR